MLSQVAVVVVGALIGAFVVAIAAIVGIRTSSPLALKAVFRLQHAIGNPRQLRVAGTPGAPTAVIRHRGRRSARAYETPVAAIATEDGFVVSLQFGSSTDWLKNVLAAGSATIGFERESAVCPPHSRLSSSASTLPDAG